MSETIFTTRPEYLKIEAKNELAQHKAAQIDESCYFPTTKNSSKLPAHNGCEQCYEIKQLSHVEKNDFGIQCLVFILRLHSLILN